MGRAFAAACRHLLIINAGVAVVTSSTAFAQEVINVDVQTAVADTARKPIGINVNYLLDDDGNRADALRGIAAALREAGVKYLRYPGGEKSDAYLWSVPPYSTSVPTLARWAPQNAANREWPSSEPALVASDGHTFRTNPLTFDEFMTICREIDCVPTIVVCYDSMYKPAQPGGVAPSRAQLLEAAREWVRYANVTKGYDVRYWEIGNESFQDHYNGGTTAADYARDIVEFAREMKSIDPTIQIGANGGNEEWWQTVLAQASASIDFLSIHGYPAWAWGSYSYYQNNAVDLMPEVRAADHALNTYAAPADRSRIRIAATEINSADWTGAWPHLNTMGHAVVLFDMLGELLRSGRLEFAQLWNTRWSGNDVAAVPALWDAFDKQNNLQATGRAMAIWGAFLKDRIVASSSTPTVKSYASYSSQSGTLTVFLINKATSSRTASVAVNGFPAAMNVDTWTFSGTGSEDLFPVWSHTGGVSASSNLVSLPIPAVSITVLEISPAIPAARTMPGRIEAEDFDAGGFWDSTPSNEGGAYRSTGVDIEATSDSGGGYNIGWIDAGEWTRYTIEVRSTGEYTVTARVASAIQGTAFRLLVDDVDVTGAIGIPETGGWQDWQTLKRNINLTAGVHRLTFTSITGWFNLNWLEVQPASASSAHAVPRRIEAEDFDDDGFRDSTPWNEGGVYRSTAVDIEPTTDAGGGYNVGWIDVGERTRYTVEVPATGSYTVTARVASAVTGTAFKLLVDDVDVTGNIAIPDTGGWQSWQDVSREITLTGGIHRLTFVSVTGWFNLNWIDVRLASPISSRILPARIEAEDFDDGAYSDSTAWNEGGAYRSTPVDIESSSDTGGGYNVGWIDAGEWMRYTIEAPSTGYYTLTARVASAVGGTAFRVLLDGMDVTAVISVPDTGGWQTWQSVRHDSIWLTAGVHRLTFVSVTGWFNLNWIAVTTAGSERIPE